MSQSVNYLPKVNSARPLGLAKHYHRSELSALITSHCWKSNCWQNKKYGDSRADYLQSPLLETCVIGRGHDLHSKVFL